MLNQAQSDIEHSCDTFANMFLVPPDDFQVELQKTRLDEHGIEELAKLYSVSREAIMYKLWKLGKITSDDYTALKEAFYGEAIREKSPKRMVHQAEEIITRQSYLIWGRDIPVKSSNSIFRED